MTLPLFDDNTPVYSVQSLSAAVKKTVEGAFGRVKVRGEVTNCRAVGGSGHLYFDLKEDTAVLKAVCWRSQRTRLQVTPENGMELVCTGRMTSYAGQSVYQLTVEQAAFAGQGAMLALLEQRKKQLQQEGLFDTARKKPLPFLPRRVGVITSPTGAVLRDILHRLQERFPLPVTLWPVAVQGQGAEHGIAAAIDGMARLGEHLRPDVVIVARGGGSLEDLWCFNEEIVARAAAACPLPLISAVGHETDTTLLDYVADRRAPTPTAAAEMAVPVRQELLQAMHGAQQRLSTAAARELQRQQQALIASRLRHPRELVEFRQQHLDGHQERLIQQAQRITEVRQQQLLKRASRLTPTRLSSALQQRQQRVQQQRQRLADALRGRHRGLEQGLLQREKQLLRYHPAAQLERRQQHLLRQTDKLQPPVQVLLQRSNQQLAQATSLLESYSYRSVLQRGFALAYDQQGTMLASREQAQQSKPYRLRFHDGDIAL